MRGSWRTYTIAGLLSFSLIVGSTSRPSLAIEPSAAAAFSPVEIALATTVNPNHSLVGDATNQALAPIDVGRQLLYTPNR
ncbi:MAG: hypothetical protein AAF703_11885 [Cyanobacteria bacterium P01_D01_bin.105]